MTIMTFPSRKLALAVCLIIPCLLVLAACGSGAGDGSRGLEAAAAAGTPVSAQPAPGGLEALPLPLSLPRRAADAPADSERLRLGAEWDPALPSNRVAGKTFSPGYAGASGRTLSDAAYAMFRFSNLAEYPGLPQIQVGWDSGGDAAVTYYVGLANFVKNRWDWYKFSPSGKAQLPGFSSFVDGSGESVAVIVSLDNGEFLLDYVLAGTNTKPVVAVETDLDTDPLQNVAPLVVSFNASASRSYGGTLTSFDFDWEGDGTWDVTGNTDGLGIHQFEAGNYETKIRATDNMGQKTTAVIEFAAINPANQPPVADFTRSPTSGDAPLTVEFDGSGSSDPDGYVTYYEWDLDNDGEYELGSESPLATGVFALAGDRPVRLRVTDNFFATATVLLHVTVAKGWHNTLVASADTRYPVTVCTTGNGLDARACVAYQEFHTRELRFQRAANIQSSSWSAYVKPVVSANLTGYSPSMDVVTTTGAPIISYGESVLNNPLYIVTATDSTGGSWNAPVLVDNESGVGNANSLMVINNLPCIAAVDRGEAEGSSKVLFFLAQDATGSSWHPPVEALAPVAGLDYELPFLGKTATGLFRRPIIACGTKSGGSFDGLAIKAASNVDGTAWFPTNFYDGWCSNGQIESVNGRPAFCGGGDESSPDQAFYIQAGASDGSAWPDELDLIAPGAVCATLQVVDGKPLLCYQIAAEHRLYIVSSTDSDGASWGEPYVVAQGLADNNVRARMTLVNGMPVIVYAYVGINFQEIRCLSLY